MTVTSKIVCFCGLLAFALPGGLSAADADWQPLFNGKDLSDWKIAENPGAFTVKDGVIVVNGERGHAFYVGPVGNHDFKNFELKAEAKTEKNSNGGIYFHTRYQESGWPDKGFEVQVNNSYHDPRKTGSLYAVKDIMKSPVPDGEWYEYHIIVKGDTVTIRINDKTAVEWTQPKDYVNEQQAERRLDRGTIALQAHDPGSTVYLRNIRIKPLAD